MLNNNSKDKTATSRHAFIKPVLHAVTIGEASYIIVRRKIQPSYTGGYVFTKSQIINTVDEQGYAERRAVAHHETTGEKVGVWKCVYDAEIGCITLLQLISVLG